MVSDSRESEDQARIAAEQGPTERITRMILNFLLMQGTATRARIFKGVAGRRKTKITILRDLLASGAVLRIGSGKKCDPFRYRLGSRAKIEAEPQMPSVYEEVIL